ncbi:MAG: hypothetical protein SGARI_000868 [Bacillariaceae sp.]
MRFVSQLPLRHTLLLLLFVLTGLTMKTAYSNPAYAKRMLQLHQQRLRLNPPAIPFRPMTKKKKKKKDDDSDDDEKKYTRLELQMDPGNDDDSATHDYRVDIFYDGTPEEWIKWLIEFNEQVVPNYPLDTAAKKILIMKTLLGGRAKERFTAGMNSVQPIQRRSNTNRNEMVMVPPPPASQWQAGLDNVSRYFFTPYGDIKNAWRHQRNYMRYDLYFEAKEGAVDAFKMRLLDMNNYLSYFPVPDNLKKVHGFDDDELVEITDRAKPMEFGIKILETRYSTFDHSLEEYFDYLRNLESSHVVSGDEYGTY